MKALIFNSGLGSRLGDLTADRPKALVRLTTGETIFERQLRVLFECGIREFVVTTGPFAELLEDAARPYVDRGCRIDFVANPDYASTNYIVSMHLADGLVRGSDLLVLHGDLVFDAAYVRALLDAPSGEGESFGSVDPDAPLPEKDFAARVADGRVVEVGVGLSGPDCCAFQPLYRLSADAAGIWLDVVARFVAAGETGVYAENAANEVFGAMDVAAFSYAGHVVAEVDTPEDLERVSGEIREADREGQPVFRAASGHELELASGRWGSGAPQGLARLLQALGVSRPLIVASRRALGLWPSEVLSAAGLECSTFSGFSPNPSYDEVVQGVRAFREGECDGVVSIGGGSAIDVAKCVKLFVAIEGDGVGVRFTDCEYPYSPISHVAIPTTAGTGSESTRFAVVYVDGVKTSVAHDCLLPDAAVLDPDLLASLPDCQRKCALLDALCQAIESHWSRRSDAASREHSARAIVGLRDSALAYLGGDAAAAWPAMLAANEAGKAIDRTTTTAPHAMSYKLTSLFGVPHGHAVALCMPGCWEELLERGAPETQQRLAEIAELLTGEVGATPRAGLAAFEEIYAAAEMPGAPSATDDELDELAASVNWQRLANFPVEMSEERIRAIYAAVAKRAAYLAGKI